MQAAYTVADLIVCRSGAMTVAEVTAAGVPAIYVPLPHGNGEQALNAQAVIKAGAARQIDDADFTAQTLIDATLDILLHPSTHQSMSDAAKTSTAGNASTVIADMIAATINSQHN